MAEGSLLTDEIRSLIGRESVRTTVTVTEEIVRRAIVAFGGDPSLELGEGQRVPGVVLVNIAPFREEDQPGLRELLPAAILVSNEFSLERPLRLGEELTATARIADITERLGGRFGHSLYVRHETEFRDPEGRVVGRTATTMMHYDPARGSERT